ncbi:MAG: response regulator, partial [Methylococcales bacterium]|nr:response regulator [Methylococcales bacterium]
MSQLGKLLVVDDEADICDFVCYVADNLGFETHSITNADEFEKIDINELKIIVLDLSMPGVDGIELIRLIAEKQ